MRERRLLELQAKWTREKATVVAHWFVQDLFQTLFPPRPPRTPLTYAELEDKRTSTPLRSSHSTRSRRPQSNRQISASEAETDVSFLKMQLLCPGISETLELPIPVPENASDAVAFVLAAESMGDPKLAKSIWSHSAIRSSLRAAGCSTSENKYENYSSSFGTWWSQHRTKALK